MKVVKGEKTMLYCPICQKKYEEGSQRFCAVDGRRLVPVPAPEDAAGQPRAIFSSIIGKHAAPDRQNPPAAPLKVGNAQPKPFAPPAGSKLFKAEPPPIPAPAKALARNVLPNEIPSGQAALGNRETHPAGRGALTWETPDVLLGQTVKGRYRVTEFVGEEEIGFTYLAEDLLVPEKKVVVRVLMNEDERDEIDNRIFAEERISLSHLNHPNIVRLIDSGELLEGRPFIVTEYFDGKTLKEMLDQGLQLNALRTARIISQAADALGEAHQNGVLHRHLKPEDIILTVTDKGAEQVKVVGFALSDGYGSGNDLAYRAPEQVADKPATFASDVYSLAVIAYQMLTARLPFNASNASDMLKLQRENLSLPPTNMRLDVPAELDAVMEKGLAFDPARRYPKARDFGDAFFAAAAAPSHWEKQEQDETETVPTDSAATSAATAMPAPALFEEITGEDGQAVPARIDELSAEQPESAAAGPEQLPDKPAWKKRSIEPAMASGARLAWPPVLGLLLLVAATAAAVYYFYTRPAQPDLSIAETIDQAQAPPSGSSGTASQEPAESPVLQNMEVPPLRRVITPPPNAVYFENSKENLSKALVKDFLGFSLYYPQDWKSNKADTKFVDISKDASSGTPIEQFMVSPYESNGTFQKDLELFPKLVEKSNEDLKFIPNYRVVSEGETAINNGWRAYEVKFQGEGKTQNGETVTLWGKRLWMPTARPGMQNGYVITMLATSLSKDVKSVEDVGTQGDLATILFTFEPDSSY